VSEAEIVNKIKSDEFDQARIVKMTVYPNPPVLLMTYKRHIQC